MNISIFIYLKITLFLPAKYLFSSKQIEQLNAPSCSKLSIIKTLFESRNRKVMIIIGLYVYMSMKRMQIIDDVIITVHTIII